MRVIAIIFTLVAFVFLCCAKNEESVTMDFDVICRDDSIKTYNTPPPSVIYFHLTIENNGDGLDSFSVYLADYNIPDGWTLQLCNAYS